MMGVMLKNDQKLTVQVKGNGPIGQIVVDANARGEVRGYVSNPLVDFPKNERGKLDVSGAVGREGFIYVIKDLGMKEPYRGSIPIISGELAEDFTYYFTKSEQTPSAVALGVLIDRDTSVKASGGYIIQLMPDVPEDEISRLEESIANVRPFTEMMDDGMSLEDIVRELLPSFQVKESVPAVFKCRCTRERVQHMLLRLGKDEIRNMLEEEGKAEVVCHFCNEKYQFDAGELESMLDKN